MSTDNTLKGVYFVKNTSNGAWRDVTTLVNGVRVLSITGLFEKGKPVNIYTAQWVNSQSEDYLVANENGTVIHENVDIEITFIVSQRYANTSATINVATQHDAFVNYLTSGKVWVKSLYANKQVPCVCLEKYEPTTIKLKRDPESNYMLGTIKLHTLEKPTTALA